MKTGMWLFKYMDAADLNWSNPNWQIVTRSKLICPVAAMWAGWMTDIKQYAERVITDQDMEDMEVWHNSCNHEVFADCYFQKITRPASHTMIGLSLTASALETILMV